MTEKSKKRKRAAISEEDISTILQRYTATTILALLQEVAQFDGVKIDWNALIKKTATGISNAREYQTLWRHLAYRHALPGNFNGGAQPLEDDSDLECELEAFPHVTSEASTEAAACVKVLIASGLPSDSTHLNSATVEAPLIINIPNGQSCRATSGNSQNAVVRGMNITIPVSVQKTPGAATEVLDANGSGSGIFPPRKRRKLWSEAEDMELIAAVQKFGEGNWANIARGEFKGDRNPSQLSQRWAIIRKRKGNLNSGTYSSGLQLSEAQRAARHAMNMALDSHPAAKSSIAGCSVGKTLNKTSSYSVPTNASEASPAQHQTQQCPTKPSSLCPLGSNSKSQGTLSKTSAKSVLSSDPVRATAVAAGARIATQSDAASLLKAAQAKNAVHIMPSGSSSMKSSMASGVSTHSSSNPNVRFISSGMATSPTNTYPAASGTCPGLAKATSPPTHVKDSPPTTQHTQSTSVMLTTSSEQSNTEITPKQGIITAEDIKVSGLRELENDQVQKNGTHVSAKESSGHIREDKGAFADPEAESKSQVDVVEISNTSPKLTLNENEQASVIGNQAEGTQNANDNNTCCLHIKEAEKQSPVLKNGKTQRLNEKQADLPSTVTKESCKADFPSTSIGESCKRVEGIGQAEPGKMLEGEG